MVGFFFGFFFCFNKKFQLVLRVLLVCKCPVKGETDACLYAGNILVTIPLDIVCLMDIHHKSDLQKQP